MQRSFLLAALTLGACAPEATVDSGPVVEAGVYGPANTWYHAPLELLDGVEPDTNFKVGAITPDLELPDQFGDMVALHQFAGRLVLLDVFEDPGEVIETPVEDACPS